MKTSKSLKRQSQLWAAQKKVGRAVRALMLATGAIAAPLFCSAGGASLASAGIEENPSEIVLGASRIRVQVLPGNLTLSRSAVLAWISRSAKAVSRYYGHFPISGALVIIRPVPGHGFGFATTDSEDGLGIINIPLGAATTQKELDQDWVLTHEMVHMAFPLVYGRDRWLVEGMATYIEPLARMQAGYLSPESIWGDLVDGLPKGLPEKEDGGLDNTSSWGRTYWGGALFCLLADLEIRKASANKKGLQTALQEIDSQGANINSDTEVLDALRLGDKAVGENLHILENLYGKMRSTPVSPDLNHLWQQLGVTRVGNRIVLSDQAPLASTRKAIEAED